MHKLHLSSGALVHQWWFFHRAIDHNVPACLVTICAATTRSAFDNLQLALAVSETVTSNLQHFKHFQNLQLAGAVSDLQHLAPPQSHLVSIIAFHSSHLVSNCN